MTHDMGGLLSRGEGAGTPDTLGTLPAVGEPGEELPLAGHAGGVRDVVAQEALQQHALHLRGRLPPVVRGRAPPVLPTHLRID